MNKPEFSRFIKEIHNSWSRKLPDKEVVEFLFEKCGSIPGEASEWLIKRFNDTHQAFPSKLHLSILRCWYDWRKEHPDKVITKKHQCRNANCIDGILYLQKPEEMYGGNPAFFVANCGDCKFIEDMPKVPAMTMYQAHMIGYSARDMEAKPDRIPSGMFADLAKNWGRFQSSNERDQWDG